MRVLIIHATPWNDILYGNNVLTNWFQGMDLEIANVYRGSGSPRNSCCTHYFQISDRMMLRSLLKKEKAGKAFTLGEHAEQTDVMKQNQKLKHFSNEFTQLCRSVMWLTAAIDEAELKDFIQEFSPDVVFTCRKASLATLRVERLVHKYTNAPFIAFTGDDEYSLKQFRFDPFFWIDRFAVRLALRKNVKFYHKYLTLSDEQAREYNSLFHIPTGVLRKCGSQDIYEPDKKCGEPIRLLYAGKLYCNRWKTLLSLAEVIENINKKNGPTFALDIYAVDEVPKQLRAFSSQSQYLQIKKAVPASALPELFRKSDIVLHVESFDMRNKYDTRLSFSTKIIDCLASGCAVMAICWDRQSGYQYLCENDLAICTGIDDLAENLDQIAKNKAIIQQYAKKAHDAMESNHSREKVQDEIMEIFHHAISEVKTC